MTDMDLEAIKARARAATPGPWRVGANFIDNFTPDKDEYDVVVDVWTMDPSGDAEFEMSDEDKAFIEGMDPTTTLALVERIERLQAAWMEAVTSDLWATFQLEELRDRLTITDEMIERAALAIAEVDEWPTNEELGGNLTGTRDEEFRDQYIDMARAALEAALGGHE
ncbi:hypothetical protein GMA10_05965 [Kocuria koreensis]|uniref:Uncharacterized protein n=1 Tax=Rothia koreensis TaxID=592378 RepID=A0A7K1LHX0_9MICC|nr:hypothetical protein [Rothia koreensis]MUN54758.1 hypothetical protein [Rothia koreensis]